MRRGSGEQCRQPRRGGTRGRWNYPSLTRRRRLRWSSPPGQGEQVPLGFILPPGYHSGKVSRQQGRHAPRRVRGSPPIPVSLPAQPWGCKGRSPLHKKTKKSPPSPEGKSALRARAGGWGQQSKLKAGLAGDKAGTPPAGYHSGKVSRQPTGHAPQPVTSSPTPAFPSESHTAHSRSGAGCGAIAPARTADSTAQPSSFRCVQPV